MTHISKQPLAAKDEEQLLMKFSSLFANSNASEVAGLFQDILTPAEKIMLIKRVAIVFMLVEDVSTYKIARVLNVSDSTVRTIKKRFLAREFSVLLRTTKRQNFDHDAFWQMLDTLLRLGMPPMGRGRWGFLDKK